MNSKLIFTCLTLSLFVHFCNLQLVKEKQDFNDALDTFVRTHKHPKFGKNVTLNRVATPNVRRSSEKGYYLHQLFNFARTQVDDNTETSPIGKKRKSRQLNNNPISHPDPGYYINPLQCPFTQNISCDTTYIYRFIISFNLFSLISFLSIFI